MREFSSEKCKIDVSSLIGPNPVPPVPITPRLMRSIPSNISSVIGSFEDLDS